MAWRRGIGIGRVVLAAMVLAAASEARGEGCGPWSPWACSPWHPWLSVGPQGSSGDRIGAEATLLWMRTGEGADAGSSHASVGLGPLLGADTHGLYLEAEAMVALVGHALPGEDFPLLFVTASGGPVLRFRDRAIGLQGTLSVAFLIVPLVLFARQEVYRHEPRPAPTLGFMVKVPVPFALIEEWLRSR